MGFAKSSTHPTAMREDQGFRVIRFWNNEVLSNTSPGTPLRGEPPSPTRGEGKKDQ
jgi:hypothetical protein